MFFKRYFKLRFHNVKKNHTCLCYTHIINVEVFRYSQLSWTFFFEKEEKLIIVCLFLFLSLSFYRHSLFLNIFKIIEDYFVLLLFFSLNPWIWAQHSEHFSVCSTSHYSFYEKTLFLVLYSIVPPSSILFLKRITRSLFLILPLTPALLFIIFLETLIFPPPPTWWK